MLIAYIFLAVLITWALYLMYCALHASMKSGKFALTPWPVRVFSWILLGVMFAADVAFNLTIGSLLFVEPPDFYHPTFTQRCASHLTDTDWRGKIATWICTGWLNPFDDDGRHCT